MSRRELRPASALAAVFGVRLLGLFMIYPVFAVYATHLQGATRATIGLALGIYGLSQGLLQIPFGLLSDHLGRKKLITFGLLVFATGSAIAALSKSIDGIIIGRAIQGAGAVGSVILALVADLTAEENRTKAMAIIGITIGVSFLFAVVLGPVLSAAIGVSGIFWLMTVLAFVGIAVTQWIVPRPVRVGTHADAETVPAKLGTVLRDGELLRLDFGIFALHAVLTSSFLVVPQILQSTLSISNDEQWIIYLPVMVVAFLFMVPAILVAEKYRQIKTVLVGSVALLALSQAGLFAGTQNAILVIAAMTAFFTAFNIIEACLPSLVTKTAPADAKGTATGVYSSSQFLGIFVGGAAGGVIYQMGGETSVFLLAIAITLVWTLVAATMPRPHYYTTRLVRITAAQAREPQSFLKHLKRIPGVVDAAIVAPEQLAYLKIDPQICDSAQIENLPGDKVR